MFFRHDHEVAQRQKKINGTKDFKITKKKETGIQVFTGAVFFLLVKCCSI